MPSNHRQSTFFIPGVGIDREVITNDICRYLGSDSFVRPGVHKDQTTSQEIEGFWVTAYRPLTHAQVYDLKVDSRKWQEEKLRNSNALPNYQAFDDVRNREEDLAVSEAVAAAAAAADQTDTPMLDA